MVSNTNNGRSYLANAECLLYTRHSIFKTANETCLTDVEPKCQRLVTPTAMEELELVSSLNTIPRPFSKSPYFLKKVSLSTRVMEKESNTNWSGVM